MGAEEDTRPDTIVRAAAPSNDPKTQAETKLRKLQDSHRLAIHMLEQSDTDTLGELERNRQLDMDHLTMANIGQAAIHSASLLPDTPLPASGIPASIAPYETLPNLINSIAYLYDLSNTVTPQARVVAVSIKNLNSHTGGSVPNNYRKLGVNTNMLAPEYGRQVAERALSALGQRYHNEAIEGITLDARRRIFKHNEIMGAFTPEHIAAIAIPLYEKIPDPSVNLGTRLSAALEGIRHLDGIDTSNGTRLALDLPVMLYHVDGEDKGRLTYLGQGRQELTEIALNTIDAIASEYAKGTIDEMSFAGMQRDFGPVIAKTLGLS